MSDYLASKRTKRLSGISSYRETTPKNAATAAQFVNFRPEMKPKPNFGGTLTLKGVKRAVTRDECLDKSTVKP